MQSSTRARRLQRFHGTDWDWGPLETPDSKPGPPATPVRVSPAVAEIGRTLHEFARLASASRGLDVGQAQRGPLERKRIASPPLIKDRRFTFLVTQHFGDVVPAFERVYDPSGDDFISVILIPTDLSPAAANETLRELCKNLRNTLGRAALKGLSIDVAYAG